MGNKITSHSAMISLIDYQTIFNEFDSHCLILLALCQIRLTTDGKLNYHIHTHILVKSWKKISIGTTQKCYVLFWMNPESHIPQNSCCMTTYLEFGWTRHAGHYWWSKDELISDILFWTPSQRCAKFGWLAKTYMHQLRAHTGCCWEDLSGVMDDRDRQEGQRTWCHQHEMMMLREDLSFYEYLIGPIFIETECNKTAPPKWKNIVNVIVSKMM